MNLENYEVYFKDIPTQTVLLKTDEDLELALEQLEYSLYPIRPSTITINGNVFHLIMRVFVNPLP